MSENMGGEMGSTEVWTTQSELSYITQLGRHSTEAEKQKDFRDPSVERQLEQLRLYRESMESRTNWGLVDPDKVRLYVDKLMDELAASAESA